MSTNRTGSTRRAFLGGATAALGAAGLLVPGTARAATPAQRTFLFFYAGGGWDPLAVLDPHCDSDGCDLDDDVELGEAGGHRWVSGPDREQVDRFYNRWGRHMAVVNGIDAHTVGHLSGSQFVLTGTSASGFADWATLLAANASEEFPLPHVVFSGPSFPGSYGQAVVRAGGGTLLSLIDGTIVGQSDAPMPVTGAAADRVLDAIVYDRVADFASDKTGLGRQRADGLLRNIERSMELEGRRFEAGLNDLGDTVLDQAIKATELFRLGLSRCAMIRMGGGFDTHGDNSPQRRQQDAFFGVLDELMFHLASTPGRHAEWMIDEVVIVAQSEFGRTPRFNGAQGRDHWPFTSQIVLGPGVVGNRSIGITDGGLVGLPIDLGTGLLSDSGSVLGCENVGTALLRLGGLDPQRFLPGVDVLGALLK